MDPRVEVTVRFDEREERYEGDHAMVVCGEEIAFTGACSAQIAAVLVPKSLSVALECSVRLGMSKDEAMRLVLSGVLAWASLQMELGKTYEVTRDRRVDDAIREMAESLGVEVPDE